MKKTFLINSMKARLAGLAVLGASLLASQAQSTFTSLTNNFDTASSATGWTYWYDIYANYGYNGNAPGYNNVILTWDNTMNDGGAAGSGSVLYETQWPGVPVNTGSPSHGGQNQIWGTFAQAGNNQYDQSVTVDGTLYTNISFDVHVNADCPTNANGDVCVLTVGFWTANFAVAGTTNINIPISATNGWYHVVALVNQQDAGLAANLAAGWAMNINCYGGANAILYTNVNSTKLWIDNIQAHRGPDHPPKMLRPAKAISGLNVTAVTGPYNREQLKTINDQTWIGHGSSPVNFSFSIKQGVDGTGGAGFQNHIFLIPSPGTETAPDYSEPNVLMMDLESTTNGGTSWSFRYKTNQPNGNAMMFTSYDPITAPTGGTLVTLNETNIRTGTWTLSVVNDNQFTMMTPSGQTTNFTVDAASMALIGAAPVTAYFGAQANNSAAIGQTTILSEAKITGTANPLDDVFANDLVVNSNIWVNNSADASAILLVPNGGGVPLQWVYWSAPANGFSLQSGGTLTTFTDATPIVVSQSGSSIGALVPIPTGNQFYRTIKRAAYQLQVLLPGESNDPSQPSGKSGTPTPVSAGTGGQENVTVNMCDATWHIVPNTDTVRISSSDGSATLPNDTALVSGTVTLNTFFFGATSGSFTITATDISNPPPKILDNTSSSVTIVP